MNLNPVGISYTHPYAETLGLSESVRLENILQKWLDDPSVEGNKVEAVRKIREAYQKNSSTLYLSDLHLTSLPEEVFTFFPNLEMLFLNNNKLSSFSLQERALASLLHLYLYNNKLTSFSLQQGALASLTSLYLNNNQFSSFSLQERALASLTTLYLYSNQLSSFTLQERALASLINLYLNNNQLSSFTLQEGALASLKYLYLSKNPLSSFSLQQGALSSLIRLHLSNNPNLSSLPMSLATASGLLFIDFNNSSIPGEQVNEILQAAKALRAADVDNRLPIKLSLWSVYAELSPEEKTSLSSLVLHLTPDEKKHIAEWLDRLTQSNDFITNQSGLAEIVCSLLKNVGDAEFRSQFIDQISVNNEDCGDRAAMGLNEIYVSWNIHSLNNRSSLQEKLKIIVGAAKTHALRNILAQMIEKEEKNGTSMRESVEIYLYYEHTLAEELGLVTAIRSMIYPEIGKRDWIDKDELIAKVEATYLDQVLSFPALDALIQKDLDAKNELDQITEELHEQMSAISDSLQPEPEEEPRPQATKELQEQMDASSDSEQTEQDLLTQAAELKKELERRQAKVKINWFIRQLI